MKYFLGSYFLIGALLSVLFIVLSFNAGFGYVYIQWRGWQVQSNLFLLLIVLFLGSGTLYMLGYLGKRLLRRNIQKYQIPKSFVHLHPYERLGIVWLLNAGQVEEQKIITTYQSSVLLYPLIRARLALNQHKTEHARHWLKQTQNPLFELAELLKIDVALAEKNDTEALDRLEFLSVQPLSIWLQPVQMAYQAELKDKWLRFAQMCPWRLFNTSYQPQFNPEQNAQWLQALSHHSLQVSEEEQQLFYDWYHQQNDLNQYEIPHKIVLLKLMSQFDCLNTDTFALAGQILQQHFAPDVLYIWLDQVLNHQDVCLEDVDQQIQKWQQQYPAQPSLSFAKWHILQRQHKFDEAEVLLQQYPDDPYMAYLRLQEVIKNSDPLQRDLKQLLCYSRQDFKFTL